MITFIPPLGVGFTSVSKVTMVRMGRLKLKDGQYLAIRPIPRDFHEVIFCLLATSPPTQAHLQTEL